MSKKIHTVSNFPKKFRFLFFFLKAKEKKKEKRKRKGIQSKLNGHQATLKMNKLRVKSDRTVLEF